MISFKESIDLHICIEQIKESPKEGLHEYTHDGVTVYCSTEPDGSIVVADAYVNDKPKPTLVTLLQEYFNENQ